jgi:hypothetical protein
LWAVTVATTEGQYKITDRWTVDGRYESEGEGFGIRSEGHYEHHDRDSSVKEITWDAEGRTGKQTDQSVRQGDWHNLRTAAGDTLDQTATWSYTFEQQFQPVAAGIWSCSSIWP